MLAYVVRRILAVFPVMAVVVLFVFVLLRISPGDPAAIIAGDYATPQAIEKIRVALGLDKPIHVQLGVYVASLLQGDLGRSLHSKLPVRTLIAQRLEPTAMLALSTLIFAVLLAVPLGILAAWRVGTWVDRAVMVFAVGGFSIPVFWLGFLLIYGFSVRLDFLPVQGYVSYSQGLVPFLRHLVLPTVTLGLIYMALLSRITRASMLEVLNQDYIRTARAKGLRDRVVVFRHALRNALIPVVTVVGFQLGTLMGSSAIVEVIFGLNGIGYTLLQAIFNRDYPLIQVAALYLATVFVLINLAVDLLYGYLDPRIKQG
jgi:peptide/nickel transport system permease protein